jgi:quinol monooxygenase YgiN
MFAVIYQSYVKPGREEGFQSAWEKVARYFVEKRGALSSTLHRTEAGYWLAYSRWPDKKTRDASWPKDHAPSSELPPDIQDAILKIQDCLDQERKIPEICMEIISETSTLDLQFPS